MSKAVGLAHTAREWRGTTIHGEDWACRVTVSGWTVAVRDRRPSPYRAAGYSRPVTSSLREVLAAAPDHRDTLLNLHRECLEATREAIEVAQRRLAQRERELQLALDGAAVS